MPGLEEGRGGRLGVSATAGFRAPRGIPIELFLMCFNFHFLLLENTDGDLLPLTHTEQGADRESSVQLTYVRPSHACGAGASNQIPRRLHTSVSPAVKWGWLRRPPKPLPAPQSMRVWARAGEEAATGHWQQKASCVRGIVARAKEVRG